MGACLSELSYVVYLAITNKLVKSEHSDRNEVKGPGVV